MDAAPNPMQSSLPVIMASPKYPLSRGFTFNRSTFTINKPAIIIPLNTTRSSRSSTPTARNAVNDVSSLTSSDPEITWQILIGALAGVAPFVVAGIVFSKRIVAQRNCEVCKGSGIVLRDKKYYYRCPRCGGFLPWQSWRRFFTG